MKAILDGHVLAESGDIIWAAGYDDLPAAAVHASSGEVAEEPRRTSIAPPACSSMTW